MEPNKFAVGIPGYGQTAFRWMQEWLRFQSTLRRHCDVAGIITTDMAYVDAALNSIIAECLTRPDWNYLLTVEHDMILSDDYVQSLRNLDPDKHKVVGALYFGRAQEDMRPIPGYLRLDGNFDRLSLDQVKAMRESPGLHRVDVVGTGALAIHRSVLEDWPADKMQWFKGRVSDKGFLGHDLLFCMEAAEQGHTIWCDNTARVGHIGSFVSDEETYLATTDYQARKETRKLTVLEGTG